MLAVGFLRAPDGQVRSLHPVGDAEWVEGWLRRSVAPKALWHLTTPLLPIGEGLATPLGTVVPVVGLDADGNLVAVLFDLHTDRPFSQILGDGLGVLQWAERLDERQVETFARYFWHDTSVSLRAVHGRLFNATPPSLGAQCRVHILSWRPYPFLAEVQQFLHRQRLAIWLFRLLVLQSEGGEVLAVAEPVAPSPPAAEVSAPTMQVQQVGSGEAFLHGLLGQNA